MEACSNFTGLTLKMKLLGRLPYRALVMALQSLKLNWSKEEQHFMEVLFTISIIYFHTVKLLTLCIFFILQVINQECLTT